MRHLILGGVKSGKSRYAEQLASDLSTNVGVIVTAEALDDEMMCRIQRHKDQRANHWFTVEEPIYLANALQALEQNSSIDVILIDCLTLWVTNLLIKYGDASKRYQSPKIEEALTLFESAISDGTKPLILVSNETNMGIMPMDVLSRRFCDEAGRLHQRLAQRCERVSLVVAGIPITVKAGAS